MTCDEICKMLREARWEKDIRQCDLSAMTYADGTGIPQPSICMYESGKRVPNAKTLCRWAEALGYELTLVPKTTDPGAGPPRKG